MGGPDDVRSARLQAGPRWPGWRRREGVEPSGDLTAPSPVLKTGGTTGRLPSPSYAGVRLLRRTAMVPEGTVIQSKDRVRELPSIDRLLHHTKCEALLARYNRDYLIRNCREVIDELRTAIRNGTALEPGDLDEGVILERLAHRLHAGGEVPFRRVVNATGTVLHTNLGRAPLAEPAIEALTMAARHPTNLEYDLASGERGKREAGIERLLVDLTSAEAATVV